MHKSIWNKITSTIVGLIKTTYSNPASFFAVHAVAFGIFAIFITPAFNAPDEYSHFTRAYQISQGNFVPDKTSYGRYGGYLPTSLLRTLESTTFIAGDTNKKSSLSDLRKTMSIRLEPAKTSELEFTGTSPYSPLTYLPQAMGIGLGRLVEARPVFLVYMARLASLTVFVLAGYAALRLIPQRKWLLALLLCLPTTLFICSSVSADVMATSASVLLVATVLAAKKQKSILKPKYNIPVIFGTSLALALSKPVFLPFVFLPLILLFGKNKIKEKRAAHVIFAIITICSICWVGWYSVFQGLDIPPPIRDNIATTAEQIVNIKTDPLQFLTVVGNTPLTNHSNGYIYSFVGVMGGLDTPLPLWMIIAFYSIVFLYAVRAEKYVLSLSKTEKTYILAIAGTLLLLTYTGLFLYWTTPVETHIEGLQGRYFWPIVILAIQALPLGLVTFKSKAFVVAYSVLILLSMILLAYRYYLLPAPFTYTEVEPGKYFQNVEYK